MTKEGAPIVHGRTKLLLGTASFREGWQPLCGNVDLMSFGANKKDLKLYNEFSQHAGNALYTALHNPHFAEIDWDQISTRFYGCKMADVYKFLRTQFLGSEMIVVPKSIDYGRITFMFGVGFPYGVSQTNVEDTMRMGNFRPKSDEEIRLISLLISAHPNDKPWLEEQLKRRRRRFARLEKEEWQRLFLELNKPQLLE